MKKIEDLTYEDLNSPRYARGQRFANAIQAMMSDWLPRDRMVAVRVHEFLFEIGYNGNVEIINVPPELDHLDKLHLERHKLEAHPALSKSRICKNIR
jgi:hypothetical protein